MRHLLMLAAHSAWNLALTDCLLPDLADCRGRSLSELALRAKFGCTVAGAESQTAVLGEIERYNAARGIKPGAKAW